MSEGRKTRRRATSTRTPVPTAPPDIVAAQAELEPSVPFAVGESWGDAILDKRKAQLDGMRAAWAANPADRPGPYAKVRLTGADVFCLAALALGSQLGDIVLAAERLRLARTEVSVRVALDLSALHLEGADLQGADLEGASLRGAHLRDANLWSANLRRANLQGADLDGADLQLADLRVANLEGAHLRSALLNQANLGGAMLEGANLRGAMLEHAILVLAHADATNFRAARLAGANLGEAELDGALLAESVLEGANLYKAHLEGANLTRARLAGANLSEATLDKSSRLNEADLDRVALAHVSFNGVDLTTVYWRDVRRLGDEVEARRPRSMDVVYAADDWRVRMTGKRKPAWQVSQEYTNASRAYLALATEMRAQGLAREARRFHYRGQLMDRYAVLYEVFARLFSFRFLTAPWVFGRWLLSWLLGTFAGYGDYLGRLFGTYVLVVLGFAGVYFVQAHETLTWPHLLPALALSVTAFHGHGLVAQGISLPQSTVLLMGLESFLGLLLEGVFVAAFTRRLISS